MQLPSTSSFGTLNKTDIYKTIRGAAVFIVGYALVATASQVSADITNGALSLGQFSACQAIILTGIGSVIELGRRLMTEYTATPAQ